MFSFISKEDALRQFAKIREEEARKCIAKCPEKMTYLRVKGFLEDSGCRIVETEKFPQTECFKFDFARFDFARRGRFYQIYILFSTKNPKESSLSFVAYEPKAETPDDQEKDLIDYLLCHESDMPNLYANMGGVFNLLHGELRGLIGPLLVELLDEH